MPVGVDLGGTKTEALALGPDGTELERIRVATPLGDYHGTIRQFAELVWWLEASLGQRHTVGVGIPGTNVASSGLVKNANSTWLNGHPLQRDLSHARHREVRCANDANCFALSEATYGAGRGCDVVFGVLLGTGCGGGIAVAAHIHAGTNGLAGEWGHTPLPWPKPEEVPGQACYCGREECLETWVSGPALESDFGRHTGIQLSAQRIAELALGGNGDAIRALDRTEDRMARGLAVVIDLLDPDVIILGGGLSNIPRLYPGSLEEQIAAYTFGGSAATPLRRNVHGDSSGVRGAAWLWDGASSSRLG